MQLSMLLAPVFFDCFWAGRALSGILTGGSSKRHIPIARSRTRRGNANVRGYGARERVS